jgi:TPP-dependent pyruvate/acetoin dehydrogenase alpha subunit
MEKEKGISRRSFIKGAAGATAAAAVLGISLKDAKAQPIPINPTFPKDKLLEIYRRMQRIRQAEQELIGMYMEDRPKYTKLGMPRTGHSSEGEEASCVGVAMAMEKGDTLTGTHRSHGYPLAMGIGMKPWMAEIFTKVGGSNMGHGGTMHIADTELGIMGMGGQVASGVPVAVGAGWAHKRLGNKRVAIAQCGDGAMQASGFNGSLNLAAIKNMPVVFVVHNNGWAVSLKTQMMNAEVKAGRDLSTRASGWAIPGITVDGNDVFAVYNAAKHCIDQARNGGGPSLLECKTYRQRRHNDSHAFAGEVKVYDLRAGKIYSHETQGWPYFTPEEQIYWLRRDPITRFERLVVDGGMLTEADLDSVRRGVKDELAAAVQFALASPFEDPVEALKYIREVFKAQG